MTRTLGIGHIAHHGSIIFMVKKSARCPQNKDSKKGRSNTRALWASPLKIALKPYQVGKEVRYS